MIQEQQLNETKISCSEKKETVEEEAPCNAENEEFPKFPITSSELMEVDEEIYKKLKIPWIPEGLETSIGDRCIDSKQENLQRSIKQYKY